MGVELRAGERKVIGKVRIKCEFLPEGERITGSWK